MPLDLHRWDYRHPHTLVALATSTMSLFYTLNPDFRPIGSPEKIGGTITKVSVAQGVLYSSYVEAVDGEGQAVAETDEGFGFDIYTRVELQGFKQRLYGVRTTIFNAATSSPQGPSGQGRRVMSVTRSRVQAATADAVVFRTFVTMSLPPGKYFVRAELYDDGNAEHRVNQVSGEILATEGGASSAGLCR